MRVKCIFNRIKDKYFTWVKDKKIVTLLHLLAPPVHDGRASVIATFTFERRGTTHLISLCSGQVWCR